jgi:hypothetical protein
MVAQCSKDLKTVTVSWDPVPGAENYYLRIDYLANNVPGQFWYVTDGLDYYLDAYGATSFTASIIPGQSYNWWVHGANSTAGIGPYTTKSFQCTDTTAPTVSITKPAAGAVITTTSVTISASASDNIGVVGVQFRINGANLGAEDTTAPYTVSWNTKNRANGTYTIEAVARDAAGNVTVSVPVSVKLAKGSGIEVVESANHASADGNATDAPVVGYAHLEAGATTDGVAIISLKDGDNVVSETSVPASAPIREGRAYVEVQDPVSTGLALANNQSEDAVISFYFTDRNGTNLAHGTFILEANRNLAAFVTEAPFNLPASMEGTFTFRSSIPIAVSSIRGLTNARGDFLMTALPVMALEADPDQSIVIPQFAVGAGWATEIILTNPTDMPLTGTVQFFAASEDGGAMLKTTVDGVTGSTFNYAVAPRSMAHLVMTEPGAGMQTGYAVVAAAAQNPVPQGISILSFSNQGIRVSESGIAAAPAATAFHTYVESSESLRSAVAITNPSAAPAQVSLEVVGEGGQSMGRSSLLDLPAGGHTARFIDELFPAIPAGFQGLLRIAASQPIAAGALRIRTNGQGELLITAMPVKKGTSPSATNSNLVFPIVVNGGGYSTEFIGMQ